jgi:hypothetical protein
MLQVKIIKLGRLLEDLISMYNGNRNHKYQQTFNEIFDYCTTILEKDYSHLSGVYKDYLKLFDFIIDKEQIQKRRDSNDTSKINKFEMNMLFNIMLYPFAYSEKITFNDPSIHKFIDIVDILCKRFTYQNHISINQVSELFRLALKVTPFTPIKNRVKKYMGMKTYYKYLGKNTIDLYNASEETLYKFIDMFKEECGEPFAYLLKYYLYKDEIAVLK